MTFLVIFCGSLILVWAALRSSVSMLALFAFIYYVLSCLFIVNCTAHLTSHLPHLVSIFTFTFTCNLHIDTAWTDLLTFFVFSPRSTSRSKEDDLHNVLPFEFAVASLVQVQLPQFGQYVKVLPELQSVVCIFLFLIFFCVFFRQLKLPEDAIILWSQS